MIECDGNTGQAKSSESTTASPTFTPLQRFSSSEIASGQIGGRDGDAAIFFRKFCAMPQSRQLLLDGEPVELGSRAFDLLIALIEGRGRLVTKDEIMDRVWPSTLVSENNLRVQMAALRRVLGKDRDVIKTIPGRGYFFASELGIGSSEPRSRAGPRNGALTVKSDQFPWAVPQDLSQPHSSITSSMKSATEAAPPVIVVVDDDPHIREALQGLLRSVGLHVEVFGSIEEFLSCERRLRPACLVLDVWLPGRSGLNFHADLTKANVQLPTIFMSGHADVPMSVQAMKAGAVEFLIKPVRHQDILNAVETAIRPRQPALP
jgi:DNA-binding response OmpR family regulator